MWFGSPCGTYVNVKINYVIQVTLWHLCKCYYCWRKKIGFLLNDSCELLLALSYVFPLCANQFKVWNSPLPPCAHGVGNFNQNCQVFLRPTRKSRWQILPLLWSNWSSKVQMPCGICDKMKVVYGKMTHDGVKLKAT